MIPLKMNRMTQEEIANAMIILNEDNLLSLGFKSVGKTCDKYEGIGYQYKDFRNIMIVDFMGIRNLELYFYGCDFITPEMLCDEGITDTWKHYNIYDTINEHRPIDIHSNEELVSICEKWASAIKTAGIKKAEQLKEYYKSL